MDAKKRKIIAAAVGMIVPIIASFILKPNILWLVIGIVAATTLAKIDNPKQALGFGAVVSAPLGMFISVDAMLKYQQSQAENISNLELLIVIIVGMLLGGVIEGSLGALLSWLVVKIEIEIKKGKGFLG